MNICPWEFDTCKQKTLCFEILRCCSRLCAGFMLEDFFSPATFIALESPNWSLVEKGKREWSWCWKRGQVFLLGCSWSQGLLQWSATWENGLSLPEQWTEHRQTAFICCAAGLNTDSSDLLICHSLAAGFACAGANPGAEKTAVVTEDGKQASDETMENTARKCRKKGQSGRVKHSSGTGEATSSSVLLWILSRGSLAFSQKGVFLL